MGGGGLFAKHQIFFEIVHKRFSADSIGFTVLFVLFTYHRSSFHPSLFIAAPFTAEYQRELDTGILTEDTLTKKIDDDIDKEYGYVDTPLVTWTPPSDTRTPPS